MHDILPFIANFALKSSQTGRNKDRVNTLKDTCDPSKFHICECKTSFFFIWVLRPVKIISLILSKVNRWVLGGAKTGFNLCAF